MSAPLTRLVCGVVGAAVVALTVAVAAVAGDPDALNRTFAFVVLATLCTEALTVDLRVGRHVESYTWAEVNAVLALALLAPGPLVLSGLAVGVVYIATRRSLVKIVFNTAAHVVGLALASVVTHAIISPTWDRPVLSAFALIVGALTYSAWNMVSVDAAIAFSQGLDFREVFRKGARLRFSVCAGNILIGLALLALAHTDPVALVAVPPCMLVAYISYRACLRTIQDRTIWRQLEATGSAIHKLDERAVAEVALTRAVSLFEADEVQLRLESRIHEGFAQMYVGRPNGVERGPYIRTDDDIDSEGEVHTEDETFVSVTLDGRDGQIGLLSLVFHERVKLEERERQLLRTYARTIATSIENARLYAEMAEHAARNKVAAVHDSLTGLPNRVLLQEMARFLMEDADGPESFAVMLLDLDHFKDVNDAFGHAAGDIVLCEISERLRKSVRSNDTVCRLGGDEFAILVSDGARATAIAERLLAVAAEPVEVNGIAMGVGGSIGFACYPEDGSAFEELLQHADAAMYQAKVRRGCQRRYRKSAEEVSMSTKDRLALVAEMRTALHEGQFELHYQPQIDLATGAPIGAEALVRWQHPTRGLLPPDEFIALVEASREIREFTRYVLDRAIQECTRWQQPGRELTVAVNLSARNLDDEQLADDVAEALTRHGLPAERLVLEITETAMLGERELVEDQLARLAELGVTLSIDDFGTGNASLAFLQRAKVHELKIDRSFVEGIVDNENDMAITRATIRLAQSLGLRAVAEGVENAQVARELVALRCDRAQGFLWGRPLPADEARALLNVDAVLDLTGVPEPLTSSTAAPTL